MDYIKKELTEGISFLENIASYVVVVMVFLLPIFFIPSLSVPFQGTKTLLIFLGVLLTFFLFVISQMRDGKISLPNNLIIFAAWALPAAYLISALFSKHMATSFIGQGFETDTFAFILAMVVLMTLIPLLFKTNKQSLYLYGAVFASFAILAAFQILRFIFGTDFLSFGLFLNSTSNLLGKWNDMAIFFGLTTILSFTAIQMIAFENRHKILLYGVLFISLLFLAIVNFFPVWLVVALFALGFFVHSLLKGHSEDTETKKSEIKLSQRQPAKRKIPMVPLAVLIISFSFVIGGGLIGNYISSTLNITFIEARPSWESTIDIGKETYKENLFFGSGPNTFVQQWTQFKQRDINDTVFWNIDFNSGIGFVPTSFITTGIVGGIAWIAFFVLLLYSGVRNLILLKVEHKFTYYIMLSSFLGSVYLWLLSILYIPNAALLMLAFVFTGVYIATLRNIPGGFTEKEILFADNARLGFVAILVLTVILLLSVVSLYVVGNRYVSFYFFQKGIVAYNIDGNITSAEDGIARAIALHDNDLYYRFAADSSLVRLSAIIANNTAPTEEQRAQFQITLASAVDAAQTSTRINQDNYLNWFTLGRVYQSVVPLGLEGAYESSKRSYEKALELHPKSPELYLALAQLSASNADNAEAREYIVKSLEMKPNYTSAIFLLSQIEIQEGNINAAIRSVESAALLESNNPVIFFQLGLLRYNVGQNNAAIIALEQAIGLNAVYSNARYFLGLSYYRVGRNDDAIEQFKAIEELNLDNEEVKSILSNLENGLNPFSGSPFTSSVRDRVGPPIAE
ncbi:tetratricopeptide repeat protein [Patescibacteria group bacterium]|nr:tetratricopeptide repeat protein [Patescibacteria group bacterium]